MHLYGRINKLWDFSREHGGETYVTYKMNVNLGPKDDIEVELTRWQYEAIKARVSPGTMIKFNCTLQGRNYTKEKEQKNITWAKCTEISIESEESGQITGSGKEPETKHQVNHGLPEEGPRPPKQQIPVDDDLPF